MKVPEYAGAGQFFAALIPGQSVPRCSVPCVKRRPKFLNLCIQLLSAHTNSAKFSPSGVHIPWNPLAICDVVSLLSLFSFIPFCNDDLVPVWETQGSSELESAAVPIVTCKKFPVAFLVKYSLAVTGAAVEMEFWPGNLNLSQLSLLHRENIVLFQRRNFYMVSFHLQASS